MHPTTPDDESFKAFVLFFQCSCGTGKAKSDMERAPASNVKLATFVLMEKYEQYLSGYISQLELCRRGYGTEVK